ncbi:MAG: alanine--tRNA ligase [Candidatus Zixiibacteriota bacterium]
MTSNEIRRKFLDFFSGYDHKVVPSSSLIPVDDPTLLFTNAGMNQFKDVFLGKEKREYKRAASSQKCMRAGGKHNDLEIVGQTTRHQTFFEMLGNFSFGDYFKGEAIAYAWEFVTKTLGIPKDRLYATVYEEDEEAFEFWKKIDSALEGRILRFGEKDNFWSMGDVGPCGPCSEIHYDQGEEFSCGPHCRGVECDCDRFSELWNLVFMQFNRDESGKMKPLPKPSVDTGAGLERLCAVMQGVHSNYDTDLLKPLVEKVVEISGKEYSPGPEGMPHRVVADHVRALSFCIADGGMPSNEGRGYVLRRILRRASYNGRLLGIHRPFMSELLDTLENIMADVYPELKGKGKIIENVLNAEEESFERTLDTGLELFEQVARKVEKSGKNVVPGEDAFKLYDTYGFPLDLTQIMAGKRAMIVDEKGFEVELERQRERSRESALSTYEGFAFHERFTASIGAEKIPPTQFVGYESIETECTIVVAFEDQNHNWQIALDRTPFYPESGGQVGDDGLIVSDFNKYHVYNTRKTDRGVYVHYCQKEGNRPDLGPARAIVNADRRLATQRNHTATHLLHRALKKVLGEHVNQSGSLVAPDRLRFDFTHFKALTPDELLEIEKDVNRKILENLPVRPESQVPFEEAKKKGAVALFGEKYGEKVRVVRIEARDSTPQNPEYYSQELCGGTHVNATGEIGQFRIVSESAIAAGIRRIEAVAGLTAFELMDKERGLLNNLSKTFKAPAEELESRVGKLLEEKKLLERELGKFKVGSCRAEAKELVDKAPFVEGTNSKVIAVKVEKKNREELLSLADAVREALTSGVATLASEINDSLALVTVVTDDLIKSGIKAGEIVKEAAKVGGGSGGGKPHLAQAGVKDRSKWNIVRDRTFAISKEQIIECGKGKDT